MSNDSNDSGDQEGKTPLDMAIEKVDSYIQNPKMVTPETLTQLKDELEAIKADVEGEETPQGETMSEKLQGGGME